MRHFAFTRWARTIIMKCERIESKRNTTAVSSLRNNCGALHECFQPLALSLKMWTDLASDDWDWSMFYTNDTYSEMFGILKYATASSPPSYRGEVWNLKRKMRWEGVNE